MELGFYQRIKLIDRLSREMYATAGYLYTRTEPMALSPHPTERHYYDIAELAVDTTAAFMLELSLESEDDLDSDKS